MSERNEYALMLARQILGDADYQDQASRLPPAEVSRAEATVQINLESMVRGIRRQVWIDSAAIAQRVHDQLGEAIKGLSIEAVIVKAVKVELARVEREAEQMVRTEVEKQIKAMVASYLGDEPIKLARQAAQDMLDHVVSNFRAVRRRAQ